MAYNRHMRTQYRYIFIFRVWPPKFTKCTTFQTLKRKSVHTRTILRSRVWPPPKFTKLSAFSNFDEKNKIYMRTIKPETQFLILGLNPDIDEIRRILKICREKTYVGAPQVKQILTHNLSLNLVDFSKIQDSRKIMPIICEMKMSSLNTRSISVFPRFLDSRKK